MFDLTGRLARLFPSVDEHVYCQCSEQNRCIVGLVKEFKNEECTALWSRHVERKLGEHGSVLPLDLRPRGLVSSRYEFDGTKLGEEESA